MKRPTMAPLLGAMMAAFLAAAPDAMSAGGRFNPGFMIGSGAADIVGKSVILHKDADDYKTQPTGNSGSRVACGIINKS